MRNSLCQIHQIESITSLWQNEDWVRHIWQYLECTNFEVQNLACQFIQCILAHNVQKENLDFVPFRYKEISPSMELLMRTAASLLKIK